MAIPPDIARRRRWPRILGLFVLGLLLIVAGALIWVWTQRYALVERQVVAALAERGIDAELHIDSATRTRAALRDIRLQHKGDPFLSVSRLDVEYQWRDLLDGRIERLALSGLDGTLTLDARGRPVDGWIPQGGGGEGFAFPPRGVRVSDARLRLVTPFGDVPLSGDVEAASLDAITARGRLDTTTLRREGASLRLSGPFEAAREDGALRLDLPNFPLALTHPQGTLEDDAASIVLRYQDGRLRWNAALSGGPYTVREQIKGRLGPTTAEGEWSASANALPFALQTRDTTFEAAGVSGRTLQTAMSGAVRDGAVALSVQTEMEDVRVDDTQRRRQLARTLSLGNAVSDVPLAQHFVPGITQALDRVLSGAAIQADVAADFGAERTVRLAAPATIRHPASGTSLTLEAVPDVPLYRYRPGAPRYAVNTRARLSAPVPITLSPLSVQVRSPDGFSVGGVASASGRVSTTRDWRAPGLDGVPARLGPLDVRFDYDNPGNAPARLNLRGSADYDGAVPGGVVSGLEAGGELSATLSDGGNRAAFAPDAPVRFVRLDTTSDWSLLDFAGTLEPDGPIYSASRAGARVQTGLRDATFRAVRPADAAGGAAELELALGTAALDGLVRDGTQDWRVGFTDAHLQSETFPVPGTDLGLPQGQLDVALSATERTRFALRAPDSTLITPLYSVRGMALDASGTAERYTLDFAGGRVRLAETEGGTPLPVMPATGQLRFADGAFTGEARTHLPKAQDQPFDVTFRIIDGRGEADIAIRDLRFAPRRLQPQELVPALRGKIAQVDGPIDADLRIRFGGGEAPTGSGTLELKGLSLGTAPGPVSGLRGTVELSSLFPVITPPGQRLTVAQFNPGVSLRDGVFVYGLVADGIAVERAAWPLGDGTASIDPFTWLYGAAENRVTLRVAGVEVGEFLRGIGNGQLSATGVIEGEIPVVVRGLDVLVEGGRLDVRDGGFIRYRPRESVADRVPNRFAADALKALENFRYDALFAEMDGPLGGELTLGLSFTGSNEDVLYGVPFAFDVSVEGELFNIASSLNTNATIKRSVGEAVRVVQ